jgi:capsular exopolysaccharide synthesis family protein
MAGFYLNLRSSLRLLRDHWKLIIAVTLLAGAASAVLTWRMSPLYASSVTFYVSAQTTEINPADAYQGNLLSQQEVQSFAELLTGTPLAQAVIGDLGLQVTPAEITSEISAHPIPQTVLLTATVTDRSPQRAQQIASSVGVQFTRLVAKLEQPPGKGAPTVSVTVVAPAALPTSPVSPDRIRNVGLALGLGLLAGIAIAVAVRSLESTIKTVDQLSVITGGKPVLGSIPFDQAARKHPVVTDDDPFGARIEAFRKIRTNLQFIDVDHPQKVLLVTSALPEEGKSTTVCNLAVMLAQTGSRVLVMEADLRRPRTVSYLGLPNGGGLTAVLLGRSSAEEVTQVWGDDLFDVMSSGSLPPNPADLLGSRRMSELIERLRRSYDVILIDAPPVLPFADAPTVAPFCDGAILMARHGKTRMEHLRRTVEALKAVDAPILGSLLTMTPRARRDGYGYGYGYYKPDDRQLPSDGDGLNATKRHAAKRDAAKRDAGDPRGAALP